MDRYHYNENYIITDNSQFKGQLFFVPQLWDWIVDGHGVDEKGHPPGDCFMIDADLLDDMVEGKSTQIAQAVRSLLQPYLGGVATVKQNDQGLVTCTLTSETQPSFPHSPGMDAMTQAQIGDVSEQGNHLASVVAGYQPNPLLFPLQELLHWTQVAADMKMNTMPTAIFPVLDQARKAIADYQDSQIIQLRKELVESAKENQPGYTANDLETSLKQAVINNPPPADQKNEPGTIPDPELTDEEYEDHANSGVD